MRRGGYDVALFLLWEAGICHDLGWPRFFLPCPDPVERELFNEYVKCRWPIHVFALDPETDQQNIADSYSSRREMQLAMSLAFVSGQMSGNNLFRYARRLETEMETIALNNTAVGFSHGNESFGWRFYPRYQTPDIDSNFTVFFRDLLIGGPNRNALLRHRQLEPGIRECVAIVIMPSFVPYVTLDACSNWFRLPNPRWKVMDSTQAVILSETVKSIQNCQPHVGDAECYRDGELERLRRRAEQLAARLPLQSMSAQVPYENTLGGFAMFSTGVTDLAPELLDWYGAPAVNLDAPTTIFLIGNHFSVHHTKVLVGGQEVTNTEMLSRQVVKVTIPAGALALRQSSGMVFGGWEPATAKATSGTPPGAPLPMPTPPMARTRGWRDNGAVEAVPAVWVDNPPVAADAPPGIPKEAAGEVLGPDYLFVDVQLATPYGASSHLLVPAWHLGKTGEAGGGQDAAAIAVPGWTTKEITLGFVYKGLGIAKSDPPYYRPSELKIDLSSLRQLKADEELTLKMKMGGGAKGNLQPLKIVIAPGTNYEAKTGVLRIAGADLDTFVGYLFDVLGNQFGPEATGPPGPVTVAETTVSLGQAPGSKLTNTLRVNWIKATGG